MAKERVHYYQVLVYIAYVFYLLFGLSWFGISLVNGGHFNAFAFFIVAIFGVQLYYKHLLTNLILGVILFFGSLFGFIDFLSGMGKVDVMMFDKVGLALTGISVLMAGILIFSFLKLNFRN